MWRAHPISESYALPVPPLATALAAGALVFLVATFWRGRGVDRVEDRPQREDLTPPMIVTRVVGVAVLLLAVAAGRLGLDDQLENLAPALVVGVAWPLLFLAAALIGPVWRWVDPWDSLARLLGSSVQGEAVVPSVWPAVVVVLPWLWHLAVYDDTLQPRSVGLALALYTLVTLAGCLVVGRTRWLSMGEPLGILLGWVALLPRRGLRSWQPPRGAEALLGVVAGGLLFGAYRRTELWGPWNTVPQADLVALAGLAASCALGAGLLLAMRAAHLRGGDPAAVARAAVPTVAAIVVAVAMERNRLTTSVQLLPGLLGDPLGRGWDLLGLETAILYREPFGTAGLIGIQLGVILAGALAGVVAAAGATPRLARLPVALSSALLADAAALAIAAH